MCILTGGSGRAHRRGQPPRTLVTKHRAAFEILMEDGDHGVTVVA